MSSAISQEIHQQVVANSKDVPQEAPSFALPLAEVGISGKTIWARLPQGVLPFAAKLSVDLAPSRRGIHMSRIEAVVAELFDHSFSDLRAYGSALGKLMIARQGAGSGCVSLLGKVPLLRRASVSGQISVDSMDVSVEVALQGHGEELREKIMIGVGVSHITACPCTQVYNAALFNCEESSWPLPTHSQRSYTKLQVESSEGAPRYEELLTCLEEALHVTQDLLKRPDEAEVVLRSHRKPQFAEDTVRETAREVGRSFAGRLPGSTRVIIESLSLESIHIHDVHCRTEVSLQEIAECLAAN